MAAAERKIPDESTIMRLFVYAVFVTSTVTLILAVAIGSAHWLAPLVGVLVTIWPTCLFYLREQERVENRTAQRQALGAHSGGGFDFTEDDDDPTRPPTPRERP